jgi:hypothetical protein
MDCRWDLRRSRSRDVLGCRTGPPPLADQACSAAAHPYSFSSSTQRGHNRVLERLGAWSALGVSQQWWVDKVALGEDSSAATGPQNGARPRTQPASQSIFTGIYLQAWKNRNRNKFLNKNLNFVKGTAEFQSKSGAQQQKS